MSVETGSFGENTREQYREHISILSPERYGEFVDLLAAIPRPEDVRKGKKRHMSEVEAAKYLASLDESDIIVGCDVDDALRGVEVAAIQGKELYITDVVVDPQYRGAGLSGKMENRLIELGKKEGCTYVRADVSMYNPANLAANFNNGFVAYAASFPYLFLTRDIDTHDQEPQIMSEEIVEVPLSEFDDIGRKFVQGYVAVDIKNVYETEDGSQVGEINDMDSDHWTVVMRKADPSVLPWNRTIQ